MINNIIKEHYDILVREHGEYRATIIVQKATNDFFGDFRTILDGKLTPHTLQRIDRAVNSKGMKLNDRICNARKKWLKASFSCNKITEEEYKRLSRQTDRIKAQVKKGKYYGFRLDPRPYTRA